MSYPWIRKRWLTPRPGIYRPFGDCTRGALQHALAELKLSDKLSGEGVEQVIAAYGLLDAFPEVDEALAALSDEAFDVFIFSNGSEDMVRPALASSQVLRRHSGLFKGVVTVDEPRAFKPTRKVYETLLRKTGRVSQGQDVPVDSSGVWLVSSNPFDIVGADAAGLRTAWVDRTGTGWVDQLGHVVGGKPPSVITSGVDTAIAGIKAAERDRETEISA